MNNNYYVKNGNEIYINDVDTVAELGMNAFNRSYIDCLCCADASVNSVSGTVSALTKSAEKSKGILNDALITNVADLATKSSVDSGAGSINEIKDRLFILEKKLESFEKHENLRNKIDNTLYRSICNEWERRSAY